VAEIASKGGKAIAVQGDVSKAHDVTRIFAETKKAFGKLDVLVNNAGVYQFAPLEEITEEHFHRIFNTNVLGLLLATKEAAKYFGADGGSIINIGSAVSSINPPTSAVYTATKAAVDSITRVLSKELGPKKIRVNSINPGMIETEGVTAPVSSAAISRSGRKSDPARPHWPARRHLARCRVSRFERFRLADRRNFDCVGWDALIPAISLEPTAAIGGRRRPGSSLRYLLILRDPINPRE